MQGKTVGRRCGGYTLIELLIVIAITGLVGAAVTAGFALVVTRSSTDFADNLIKSQVQMAGTWISRDVVSAKTVTLGSGSIVCSMQRERVDSAITDNISYEIEDGTLFRKLKNGSGGVISQSIIAQNINGRPNTDFIKATWNPALEPSQNNTYVLTVSATYRDRPYGRTFKMTQRWVP